MIMSLAGICQCQNVIELLGKISCSFKESISVAQPYLFGNPDSCDDFDYDEQRSLSNTSAPLPLRISKGLTYVVVCHLLTLEQSTAM